MTWTQGGQAVGGAVPNYKYTCNKPESEFLTCQAEYQRSCKHLGSCLLTGCSMMKSSMSFKCGTLPQYQPDVIHVISVPRPSPFFAALPLLYIILKASQREQKQPGRLGNEATCFTDCSYIRSIHADYNGSLGLCTMCYFCM